MNTPSRSHEPSASAPLSRRKFIAGTGASVLAFSIMQPEFVRGAQANSKINVGLMGCGGRGRWILDLFHQHGGYQVAAVHDYFPERAAEAGKKYNVSADRCFSGLSGYQKMLDQEVNAVIIQSPPYFHPEQAAAAVDAGKHVYLAKPAAVDVPGCTSIADSAKKAASNQRVFFVDFQTRANQAYQDAAEKVHSGELGKLVLVEASYQCNLMFENLDRDLRNNPDDPETRLRAWPIDRALSGDIITEQNIHALDVACWMLNADPVSACGTGGRRREFLGNCWDHFAVVFRFPKDIICSFNSRQAGFAYDDIMCRVYGLNGTVDTHYAGKVSVHTRDFRSDGNSGSLYKDGAVTNIATFHDCVTKGDCRNSTVAPSVRSNLTTILGRTAAYQGGEVTWKDMMKANEKLVPNLKGLKA